MPQSLTIQHFINFTDLLDKIQERNHCLLNLTKLFEFWEINNEEIELFIQLLMRLQKFFFNKSESIRLCGMWRDSQIYLKLETPSEHNSNHFSTFREIELHLEDSNILNDVIHYFEHINLGKGFNLKGNNTEFAIKVRKLYESYPFFFEKRESGVIFPTKFASQLGNVISSYKKSHRKLQNIEIEDYHVRVK